MKHQIPFRTTTLAFLLVVALCAKTALPFAVSPLFATPSRLDSSHTRRKAVQSSNKGGEYVPKWTKKKTLAEETGSTDSLGFENVGLKGTIPVVFRQGNETRKSMAWAGQPMRDVATQAGQFIKYGCGKGECGTCECMVDGKWVRPCTATVPAMVAGEELVVQVKAVKNKSKSSGKFFSIRSFIMGFWNNLIGMFGFVRFIKAAKKNWQERKAYEDLILQKTMEKKMKRGGGTA